MCHAPLFKLFYALATPRIFPNYDNRRSTVKVPCELFVTLYFLRLCLSEKPSPKAFRWDGYLALLQTTIFRKHCHSHRKFFDGSLFGDLSSKINKLKCGAKWLQGWTWPDVTCDHSFKVLSSKRGAPPRSAAVGSTFSFWTPISMIAAAWSESVNARQDWTRFY